MKTVPFAGGLARSFLPSKSQSSYTMTAMPATAQAPVMTDLIQAAFEQLACPLDGHSLYQTLEDVVRRAYELGFQNAQARPVLFFPAVARPVQPGMDAV